MAMAVLLISGVLITAVVAQHFARLSNVEQKSVQVIPTPHPLLYTIDAIDEQIEAGIYNTNFLNCTVLSLYKTCYVIPWILISYEEGISVTDVRLFLWSSYNDDGGTKGELELVLNQINATAIEGGIVRVIGGEYPHDNCRLLSGESLVLRYSIKIIPPSIDGIFDIYLWAEDYGA